jgi:hypothetical protein
MRKFGNSEFYTKSINYYNCDVIRLILSTTNFKGDMPTKKETKIAKKYL